MLTIRDGDKVQIILQNDVERSILEKDIKTYREVLKIRGEAEDALTMKFHDNLLIALNSSLARSDSDRLKSIADHLHNTLGFPKFERSNRGKRAYTIKVTAQPIDAWERRGDQKFEFLNYFPEDAIPYWISIGPHTMSVENQKGAIPEKYVKRAESRGFLYDTMPGRITTKLSRPIALHSDSVWEQVTIFMRDLREIFLEDWKLRIPTISVLVSGRCTRCQTVVDRVRSNQYASKPHLIECPHCHQFVGSTGLDYDLHVVEYDNNGGLRRV